MLLVALIHALLDATVVWAVVNHENQVYSGCGFEAVQGQPSMFKFCNAFGHCIKSSCGTDRVFSKVDCGCVPSLGTSFNDDIRLPQLGRSENVTSFKAKAHVITSVVSAFVDATGRMISAASSGSSRRGWPTKSPPKTSTLPPTSTTPTFEVPVAELTETDLLSDKALQSNSSLEGTEKTTLEKGSINSPVSKANNFSDTKMNSSIPSLVSESSKPSTMIYKSTTARFDVQRFESTTASIISNATQSTITNSTFVCRTEVNISGMNDRELLTGESSVGTVYIGVRGLSNKNGAISFNGTGLLWIPYYDNVTFPSGLTISLEIQEDISRQVAQGVVSNCGDGVLPSFSIVLDPVSKSIRFKVVVVSADRSPPSEDILEVSVPYEFGINKAIEMECDGHNLIGRVGGHVAGKHISVKEKYVVSSRPKPIYIGKGCREEQTHDFFGEVKNVLMHRCTRSLASQ